MPLILNGSTGISATGGSKVIADGAIDSAAIAEGTIATADIANNAVTEGKLASGLFAAKAWVNFNGTGTVAIRASGNVTSITDGGVGLYTMNFTTALPDANYAAVAMDSRDSTGVGHRQVGYTAGLTKTASAFQFDVVQSGATTRTDVAELYVAIFD